MLRSLFRWCLRIALLIWLVLLVLLGAKFAMKNSQPISVDLIFWPLPEASIGFVLCVALLVGVLLGVATIVPALVMFKARIRSLKSKLAKNEKNLATAQSRHLSGISVKRSDAN